MAEGGQLYRGMIEEQGILSARGYLVTAVEGLMGGMLDSDNAVAERYRESIVATIPMRETVCTGWQKRTQPIRERGGRRMVTHRMMHCTLAW